MSDDIAGWEIVSEHVNRHGFWEMLIGLFAGLRPPPTITYTVRLKSTDHIELVFRHRLQKGDIDPKDLFTSLQGFAQRGGDHVVRQFSTRCFPLLSKETQAEIRGLQKFHGRRERRRWRDRAGRAS